MQNVGISPLHVPDTFRFWVLRASKRAVPECLKNLHVTFRTLSVLIVLRKLGKLEADMLVHDLCASQAGPSIVASAGALGRRERVRRNPEIG